MKTESRNLNQTTLSEIQRSIWKTILAEHRSPDNKELATLLGVSKKEIKKARKDLEKLLAYGGD